MKPYDRLKDKKNTSENRLNALIELLTATVYDEEWELFCEILLDEDEHAEVRCAIALGLAKLSKQDALEPLLKASRSSDATVKTYVMVALGTTAQEAAIPVLIEALEDSNDEVFNAAAEAIGALGSTATDRLVDLLHSSRDDIRCVAAWQLGQHHLHKAIPALLNSIETDQNIDVVALCIWALGEIGLSTPEIHQTLSNAKKHQHPDVHERAQRALKKISRHLN